MNRFDTVWNRHRDLEFPEEQLQPCPFAQQFSEWATALVATAIQEPTDISINQAKVLLLDRYWSWYATVPKAHQNVIGNRNGHICIWMVFRDAYMQLRAVELSITPPRLFEPPPPEPKPVAQIAGLFLGEELEE